MPAMLVSVSGSHWDAVCVRACIFAVSGDDGRHCKARHCQGCGRLGERKPGETYARGSHFKQLSVMSLNNATRSHPEMVGDVACDLEPVPILPAPVDTLYIKTSLFTASLFTFESFIKCLFSSER